MESYNLTSFGGASDEYLVKMTTFPFQCICDVKVIYLSSENITVIIFEHNAKNVLS